MHAHLILALLVLTLLAAPAPVPAAQTSDHAVAEAVSRTRSLTTYRLSLTATARGTMVDPAARTVINRATTLFDFRGSFRAEDAAFTYRTPDSATRGYDPQRGLEAVVVAGVTYAAGPLPVSGAAAPRWYDLGGEPPAAAQPPQRVSTALNLMTSGVNLASLTRLRFEPLDGRRCAVYRGDAAAVSTVLLNLEQPLISPDLPLAEQLAAVTLDRTAYMLWACDDGFVHRIDVAATGFAKTTPARRFGTEILLRLSDINSRALAVAPPPDALPLAPSPPFVARIAAPADVRLAPDMQGRVLGRALAREEVLLLDRTADGRWYRVISNAATGWLGSAAIIPPRRSLATLPVFEQGPAPTAATSTATTPPTTPTP
jgi:hypothetical protein